MLPDTAAIHFDTQRPSAAATVPEEVIPESDVQVLKWTCPKLSKRKFGTHFDVPPSAATGQAASWLAALPKDDSTTSGTHRPCPHTLVGQAGHGVVLQFRLVQAPQHVVAEDQLAGVSQAGVAVKGAPSALDGQESPWCWHNAGSIAPSSWGGGL